MTLFYDKNYVIVEDGLINIVYFGNINRAIKMSYLNLYYLKCILERDLGSNYDEEFIAYKGLDKERFRKFVDFLCANKILFRTQEELEKNDFVFIYKKIISKRSLSKAYLHITQRCNLNCKYCYNKRNLNGNKAELSTREWIKVISELETVGIKTFILTGGEPFLNEDLLEIVLHIDGEKILLTNGTLLTEKKYKILENVNKIIISLDSTNEEENELNRQNSLRYRVIKNIENLPLSLREKVNIRSVLTKNNISSIHQMTEYFETELGISHIINGCLPNSKGELDEFIPVIDSKKVKFYLKDMILCGAGVETIAIDSNGDIYPCQSLIKKEFRIGSILSEDWKEKLELAVPEQKLSKGILDIPRCMECVYKYICGGGCKAITYNIYSDTNRTNDFMCEYYKNIAIENIKRLF